MKKQFKAKPKVTSEQINFWMESTAEVNGYDIFLDERTGHVLAIIDPASNELVCTRREYIADMERGCN